VTVEHLAAQASMDGAALLHMAAENMG